MHETRCLWCETVTKTETEFYALSLAITQNSSLTNALRSFRCGSISCNTSFRDHWLAVHVQWVRRA